MAKNSSIGRGADAILYNLAFSPRITYIDFSDDLLNSPDTAEAIYKLVKISGSLETLILHNTQINNQLKEEFFIALGENKTLTHLNLNNVTFTNLSILQLLAKSCAMNKKKNGNLKYLSMVNAFQSYLNMKSFLEWFKVSDYDQEMWYGDKKIAKEMTKEQLEKKLEFGLEYINIGQSVLAGNGFKHKEIAKRKDPQWPIFMDLFAQNSLQVVNLSVCNMSKQDMELLADSLNENPRGKS
jgi:hypothetical protein